MGKSSAKSSPKTSTTDKSKRVKIKKPLTKRVMDAWDKGEITNEQAKHILYILMHQKSVDSMVTEQVSDIYQSIIQEEHGKSI